MIESIAAIEQKISESDKISKEIDEFLAKGLEITGVDFGAGQSSDKPWGDYQSKTEKEAS